MLPNLNPVSHLLKEEETRKKRGMGKEKRERRNGSLLNIPAKPHYLEGLKTEKEKQKLVYAFFMVFLSPHF